MEPFGDIWLRDTGPILLGGGKERCAQGFGFNGWGGKYDLTGDQDIGERLARRASFPFEKAGWVLEGGAIDVNGRGSLLTTEECLLSEEQARNPGLDRVGIEKVLADVSKILPKSN